MKYLATSAVSASANISAAPGALQGARFKAAQVAPRSKPRTAPLAAAEKVSSPATCIRRFPRTEGVTVSVTDRPHGDQSERTAAKVANEAPIHRAGEPIRPIRTSSAAPPGGRAHAGEAERPLLGRLLDYREALAAHPDQLVDGIAIDQRLKLVESWGPHAACCPFG